MGRGRYGLPWPLILTVWNKKVDRYFHVIVKYFVYIMYGGGPSARGSEAMARGTRARAAVTPPRRESAPATTRWRYAATSLRTKRATRLRDVARIRAFCSVRLSPRTSGKNDFQFSITIFVYESVRHNSNFESLYCEVECRMQYLRHCCILDRTV